MWTGARHGTAESLDSIYPDVLAVLEEPRLTADGVYTFRTHRIVNNDVVPQLPPEPWETGLDRAPAGRGLLLHGAPDRTWAATGTLCCRCRWGSARRTCSPCRAGRAVCAPAAAPARQRSAGPRRRSRGC
ncbi:hypothetical protein GCM10010255_64910 [Streptomyces coeruleofuscus]|uniref:Uncharacterized protein n=1 Tax=Streptomyces coeruleofuscus TaxID=66879 RepID=A0ABN3IXY4_9ACTN